MATWITDNAVEFYDTAITWEPKSDLRTGSIVNARGIDFDFKAQSLQSSFKADSITRNFSSTKVIFNFKANKG